MATSTLNFEKKFLDATIFIFTQDSTKNCLTIIDQIFHWLKNKKKIMSEWSKNSWLVYSLSSIRLKRCHSTMVLFLTLCYLLKKNWKKQEENVLILRHMGKENDVLIWVKLSQVKNFMFYSSVYYHTSRRSPCTHNIEYIENWKKSIEGDMKKNLLLLLWFPEIFSLCLTLGL